MLCFSARATYIANNIDAGALIVIDVLTLSKGIPSKRISMSIKESIATPTFPTSPLDNGWSESYQICVGRSKATLKTVCPGDNNY